MREWISFYCIAYDMLDNFDVDDYVPDTPFRRASCGSVCNVRCLDYWIYVKRQN